MYHLVSQKATAFFETLRNSRYIFIKLDTGLEAIKSTVTHLEAYHYLKSVIEADPDERGKLAVHGLCSKCAADITGGEASPGSTLPPTTFTMLPPGLGTTALGTMAPPALAPTAPHGLVTTALGTTARPGRASTQLVTTAPPGHAPTPQFTMQSAASDSLSKSAGPTNTVLITAAVSTQGTQPSSYEKQASSSAAAAPLVPGNEASRIAAMSSASMPTLVPSPMNTSSTGPVAPTSLGNVANSALVPANNGHLDMDQEISGALKQLYFIYFR